MTTTTLSLNESIIVSNEFEKNEKFINRLKILELQNVAFNEEDLSSLKEIAKQCISEGGKVVKEALYLLPECERLSIDICEEDIVDNASSPILERISSNKLINEKNSKVSIEIYPNPSTDKITIALPNGIKGTATIFDSVGKALEENLLRLDEVTEIKHNLSPGIYFIHIELDNGDSQIEKITVSK